MRAMTWVRFASCPSAECVSPRCLITAVFVDRAGLLRRDFAAFYYGVLGWANTF